MTSAVDFVLVRQTLAGRAAEARVLTRRKFWFAAWVRPERG